MISRQRQLKTSFTEDIMKMRWKDLTVLHSCVSTKLKHSLYFVETSLIYNNYKANMPFWFYTFYFQFYPSTASFTTPHSPIQAPDTLSMMFGLHFFKTFITFNCYCKLSLFCFNSQLSHQLILITKKTVLITYAIN